MLKIYTICETFIKYLHDAIVLKNIDHSSEIIKRLLKKYR